MEQEEVVAEKAGANVTEVGERNTPSDFRGGWINVIYAAIFTTKERQNMRLLLFRDNWVCGG